MSLYSYYFNSNSEEQAQGSSPKSEELPQYNCTWSFLDTPEMILSDTEDGSSCGGEDVRSYTWEKPEHKTSLEWSEKDTVQFDTVNVREYIRRVGVHPACFDSYPLCIGWAHGAETSYDLDEYETMKTRKRRRRRGRRAYLAKRLDAYTRKNLLEREYSIDPDLQDGLEIGVECQLEMEPDLADDRWGQASDMDSPLEEIDLCNGYSFPSSMMKVQILED